tara:strand:+ start:4276 stop:4443 length:168 start_codon:yes stop_codon:yes gene_type:complete
MSQRRYNRINEKEKIMIKEMYQSKEWKVPVLAEMFRVTTRRIYQIIGEAKIDEEK